MDSLLKDMFTKGNKLGPRFEKGYTPWNKGKKIVFSNEHRKNLSLANMGHAPTYSAPGEKNWNWQGGKTSINKRIRVSGKYKRWVNSILERDDYICQICFKRGGKLNADHIKAFSLYPELRFELSNGRTLCIDCHKQTDNYGGRILKK